MSYWIPYEVLKMTTNFLLSPAYICSDVFLASIGYKRGTEAALLDAIHQTQPRIANSDLSILGSANSSFSNEQNATHSIEDLNISDPVVENDQPSSRQYSAISSISTGSFDSLDPVIALYQKEITTLAPISTRPLSSALAIFSYRATRCFSSFELLSEYDFGIQNLGVTECVQPGEVVSIEQVKVLRKVLPVEVQVIERIIEEAIQNRGVEENLKIILGGTTYFDSMKMSFVNVGIDSRGICTLDFLDAVESSLTLFKQFASSAFVLVQNDVLEDIRQIRVRYDLFPEQCRTLEMLIRNEETQRRKLATTSTFWIVKGFKFVSAALRFNLNSDEELYVSFTRSWELEYSLYFSWIVRQFFSPLVRAVPNRVDFYQALGDDIGDVRTEILKWIDALDNIVNSLEQVLPKKV